MAQGTLLVGIDVAKAKIDACIRVLKQQRQFPASSEGQAELIAWLREHGVGVAVLEASGGYERAWAEALREADITARIVNPKRVRHFAEAAGRLAKNDPIDAEMIARFGEVFDEERVQSHDPAREDLQSIVVARQGLIDMQTQLASRYEHDVPKEVQKAFGIVDKALARAVAKLETAAKAAVNAKPEFTALAEIITSTPGLGAVSAAACIARLPEIGKIGNKQAAALLGSAPYDDDSGGRSGVRHIQGGRGDLRSMLYMAVVGAATQHNPVLIEFYKRLRAKGKPAKSAIVACMRKLIVILNTMVKNGQKWDPARHNPRSA